MNSFFDLAQSMGLTRVAENHAHEGQGRWTVHRESASGNFGDIAAVMGRQSRHSTHGGGSSSRGGEPRAILGPQHGGASSFFANLGSPSRHSNHDDGRSTRSRGGHSRSGSHGDGNSHSVASTSDRSHASNGQGHHHGGSTRSRSSHGHSNYGTSSNGRRGSEPDIDHALTLLNAHVEIWELANRNCITMFLKIKATSGREDLVKSWVDCEKRVLKQRKLISLEVIQEYVKLRNISGLNGEQREALEDIEGRLNAQVDEAEQVGLWHPSRPWMDWKD